jgi:hypothetical protein
MDLVFDRGDTTSPKGHALLYFREAGGTGKLYATYVVVLPISIDLVKYMPPFLANQIPQVNAQELSAFAFPPMPEEVGSQERLETLVNARGDDMLFGGEVSPSQVQDMLVLVNDLVQEYAQRYQAYIQGALPVDAPQSSEFIGGPGVNEVLFELMGERDRLAELAKLIGQLRFAVEGNDVRGVQEAEEEIGLLARYLPDHYQVDHLVKSAKDSSRTGGDLAQLYLDRCYKLADEDYTRLKEIEEQIKVIESAP